MSAERCAREDELLDALSRGFIGDELMAHARSCAECRELQTVAGAVLDDRAIAIKEAAVPGAGAMWWRITMRRRREAEAQARRSLLIGQAATLLITLTLIASCFGSEIKALALSAGIHSSVPLLVIAAMWVVAAPVVGWIAVRQK